MVEVGVLLLDQVAGGEWILCSMHAPYAALLLMHLGLRLLLDSARLSSKDSTIRCGQAICPL